MKTLLFTTLLLAGAVHAEMKPNGALVETLCGNVTRSHQICLAKVQGSNDLYIVKKELALGSTDRLVNVKRTYARVTNIENNSAVGATSYVYTAYSVGEEDGYTVQKEVSLHTTQVVRPGLPMNATYFENNEAFYGNFTMEHVAVTRDL